MLPCYDCSWEITLDLLQFSVNCVKIRGISKFLLFFTNIEVKFTQFPVTVFYQVLL